MPYSKNLARNFKILPVILILQVLLNFVDLKPNYPICIVGGGMSGLSIGSLLQEKGYEVRIFEARDRVGGKLETFRIGDSVLIEKVK